MNIIENITADAIQNHFLEFSRGSIELQLLFEQSVQIWKMNVTYTNIDDSEPQPTTYGVKLTTGTTHIKHRNYPFDFAVIDTTNQGVDPYRIDDFERGRCKLYFITPDEMIRIRGVDVR